MNDCRHPHSEPKFADLIKRELSENELEQEVNEYRRICVGQSLPKNGAIKLRKNEASLSREEQEFFKASVVALVHDGGYSRLVEHHRDHCKHRMHGFMGVVGKYRFLAWHRRYLLAFEAELKRATERLDRKTELVSTPYWRWPNPFPSWLADFLPMEDPYNKGQRPPPRTFDPGIAHPNADDVKYIIEESKNQFKNVKNLNTFGRFSIALEGSGKRNGQPLPAHNHVHAWVGSVLGFLGPSPCDPFFWLLHSEVDRLWHIWQLRNPNELPPLCGVDRVLDPWAESIDDVHDIAGLGYSYDSLNY